MFERKERATALLALRSSASSTSSPMYSPECNVSTCKQHDTLHHDPKASMQGCSRVLLHAVGAPLEAAETFMRQGKAADHFALKLALDATSSGLLCWVSMQRRAPWLPGKRKVLDGKRRRLSGIHRTSAWWTIVGRTTSRSGKSMYLHKRVDDVILAAVEVLQQAALEVGADQAASCFPGRLTCNPGLQSLRRDARTCQHRPRNVHGHLLFGHEMRSSVS